MAFSYYLPTTKPTIAMSDIQAAGLSHAVNGKVGRQGKINSGPDGGSGVTFNGVGPDRKLGYHTDTQTWNKVPRSEAWAGCDHDTTPDHLARAKQLDGRMIELADGNEWHIPIARSWVEEEGQERWFSKLPKVSVLDDNGEWTAGPVIARHADLFRYAEAWWDVFAPQLRGDDIEETDDAPDAVKFDFAFEHEACVCALQTNYHVSAIECSLLGLFDEHARGAILSTLVDWESLVELLKKKAQLVTSSTPDGEQAAT